MKCLKYLLMFACLRPRWQSQGPPTPCYYLLPRQHYEQSLDQRNYYMLKYLAALQQYKCKNVQTLKQMQISTQ